MDPRSEACLAHVHPDLAKVMRAASQTPQPFVIIYGIRTEASEQAAVASGHSHTLHSRHLPQSHENMKACAVDVAALVGGKVTFAKGHEAQVFGQINKQIQAAAVTLGIPVAWGGQEVGAWSPGVKSTYRDWDHWQLPWAQYP